MSGRGLVVAAAVAGLALAAPLTAHAGIPRACAEPSWPEYGHDAAHSFSSAPGCARIDRSNAATLVPKWVLHTTDSVTASPSVVDGKLYVGAWDGTFYAVDAERGTLDWTFSIADDHAVAFGRIVSSAAVTDVAAADGTAQRVIVFGGGATLEALDPDGRELASIDLDPRDAATRAAQAADPPTVEIESSPAVADVSVNGRRQRVIYVGLDVHNRRDVGRTGVVAVVLRQGRGGAWVFEPLWKFDVESGTAYAGDGALTAGSGTGFGCGGVWSSPAVDAAAGLVAFGSSSCSYPEAARAAGLNFAEAMFGVDTATGRLRWKFQPAPTAAEAHLDDDFGASVNLYRAGGRLVAGEGRKDADYYGRDARTGREVFTSPAGTPGNLQDDFAVGGFLGSTAVWSDDAGRARAVVGATAIPLPRQPGQLDAATWAVRAIDPADGHILWTHRLAGPTYAPVSVANGVAFVPDTFTASVQALDATTGRLLWTAPLGAPPASGAAVVGDSVYLGGGTRETDAEFKSVGTSLQDAFTSTIGNHPLSPASGIFAFHLPGLPATPKG